MAEDGETLATVLRRSRQRRQLTQEGLAELAGVSVRTVRGIEGGHVRRPQRESLRLLANALDLDQHERHALFAGPRNAPEFEREPSPTAPGMPWVVPSQLPPDVGDFTGREAEARALEQALLDGSSAVALVAVSGSGGVGKTTLAVHVAHALRERFPDGQLVVDLHGTENRPRPTGEALAGLLRALGVADPAIPLNLDDRRDLYRSVLAGRRVLVVLDNAAGEAQVRPLLPGGSGCGVIVTSRRRLLALEGARHIDLRALSGAEALALLGRVAGQDGLADDTDAAAIVEFCGRLPLALRVAGARLGALSGHPPTWLRERLGDERRRLDELAVGDLGMRASIALSYQALDPQAQQLLLLLGMLAPEHVPSWVAAALLDANVFEAEGVLQRLVDASLVEVVASPLWPVRYRLHDLIRLYARDRAEAEPPQQIDEALDRAAGAWLALAHDAEARLPDIPLLHAPGAAPRWCLEPAATERITAEPLIWFSTEWPTLAAEVEHAARRQRDEFAWELAAALDTFFVIRSLWEPWRLTQEVALAACVEAGNLRGQATMRLGISARLLPSGEYDRSRREGERALSLFARLGDRAGEARALNQMAVTLMMEGRAGEALLAARRASRLAADVGDAFAEADAEQSCGRAFLRLGRIGEARVNLTAALDLARGNAAPRAEAQNLWLLAAADRDEGDLVSASERLEQALGIVRALADQAGEGRLLVDLATAQERLGLVHQAIATLERAQRIGAASGTTTVVSSAEEALDRLNVR